VALTLARRHPGRVRGLLLFSTFARYPLADAQPLAAALEAWKRYGDNLPDEPATALLRRLALPAQVGLDCPPRLREAYLKQPSAHLPAVRAKCSLSLQFDGRPWLRDLQVPAFVLSGTQDRVVPPSAGRELAGRLLFGRFHLLRGGHLVHIVQAARVGRLVRAWAQELLDEVTQAPGLAQVLPLSS